MAKIPNKLAAELIGFVLGDGNIAKEGYKLTMTGSLDDLLYYRIRIIPLIKKYFGGNVGIYRRKDKKGLNAEFWNKKLVQFLLHKGLKKGKKINPKVPKFIINNPQLHLYFLRGLFDTDGCLKFSKQTKEINYYPRIRISLKPSKLTRQIKILLIKHNINHCFGIRDNSRGYGGPDSKLGEYEISGKEKLDFWFKKVCPKNPVHISKYYIWRLQGHVTPKTTLPQRINFLKDNFIKEDFIIKL